MDFDYYFGAQSDQFSFIRIPRLMLTDAMFSALSIPAKLLYGVLLDRMSLSRRNNWIDDKNRVYIIYQVGEIQDDLGFTKKKALELLSELENFGLLEKKRRGRGLPNVLYLKEIENRKSSVRCKVEHPFLIVKRQFGYAKVVYRGIAKNMNRFHVLFASANLVKCFRAGRTAEFCRA